jgi:glycosyltransferase involved in cell wall biosynthesis
VTFDEIGIVVIGRNEGQRLLDCFVSLRSRASGIVYVDSGSTDGSAAAAEQLGAFVVRLDMAQPFTAARARNEGFAAIMTLKPNVRFVQFIDGDCELASTWLEAALAFIAKQNDIAVVCGRRRERYPERSVYNRLCDIEWNTPIGEASACGGDSLVRVAAFKEAGGFQSQLVAGEEPELCARLRNRGWKVWRLDAEMTRHDAAIAHFGQWWARTVRSGYGYAEVSKLHSRFGVHGKEIMRAIFWVGLMPLVIGFGTVVHPSLLLVALIYPLQICRVALRIGPATVDTWVYALFIMLAKFAEIEGILKFYWSRWRGRGGELIEYKRSS